MVQMHTSESDAQESRILPEDTGLFYGGEFHASAAGTMSVSNPADQSSLAEVTVASTEDIDKVVQAANEAFPAWAALSPMQRSVSIRKIIAVVREHAHDFALLDAMDCGNPYKGMMLDVQMGTALMDYFAGLASEVRGATVPMPAGSVNYVAREPLGVVARMLAYNHPLLFSLAKMTAPLVVGNTVILKPSEHTPLSTLRLAELIRDYDLLPPGVFNVVNGGKEVGKALAEHAGIAAIGVIGSVQTGRAVMAGAASTIKNIALELGGKNALIGYPDADPAKVAAGCVKGMNFDWTGGQSCGSTTRLFAHVDIYDDVVDAAVAHVKAIKQGMPVNPETEMGCLSGEPQFNKVMGYIETARRDGVKLAAGGNRGQGELADGFFVEPTVFVDVDPYYRMAREEMFGPVFTISKWGDEEALYEAVNSVPYGLTASVYTNDLATAHEAAARIQAGYVWVNNSSNHFMGAPFGGWKQSGIGRGESIEELYEFSQQKNINITLNP